MPSVSDKQKLHFYDTIADRFDAVVNMYDLGRRIEIVFGELLLDEELRGRRMLDAGCGTGWFSRRAVDLGADVFSLDIGQELLRKVREKCATRLIAADACALPFPDSVFYIVVASESIEHTLDPKKALLELHRVLRPGGALVVTVPNQLWHFSATFAAIFHLRPYEGFEHWLGWFELRRELEKMSAPVDQMFGFHIVPPLIRWTRPIIRFMDRFGRHLGPLMLNIAVRARKAGTGARA